MVSVLNRKIRNKEKSEKEYLPISEEISGAKAIQSLKILSWLPICLTYPKTIAMTTEKYYDLKVYIKTIILPGTLPFESGRSTNPASKGGYQKWIKSELRLIGPRFFPRGAERLVWPKDYDDCWEGVKELDEDERYAEWEKEEEMMIEMIEMMEKKIPVEDSMEGMDAEPLELEDVLGLMKPEMFSNFPDFVDEHFDWDAVLDVRKPEPIARLLLLLS
ncbi:hypothetical protein L873DRAFT_1791958 [Choiromyces venosus 120613-1]|uniref:Uncharacterized protein n=1 Tax=Choiromyces venosus 120613-1 TaxID=1336337 RepID=A0A3N4JPN6_9PEZI|nr:hypothetical protein L873DRAFT_1791958 [Choiromyces venosus 120613-1]